MMQKYLLTIASLLLLSLPVYAVQEKATPAQKQQCNTIVNEAGNMPNSQLDETYHKVLRVARCVKCANESLESSRAGLANDLRKVICLKVLHKKSVKQIKSDLVESYGPYILYEPPFSIGLWLVPIFIFIVAVILLVLNIRKNNAIHSNDDKSLDEAENARLEQLLKKSDEEKS